MTPSWEFQIPLFWLDVHCCINSSVWIVFLGAFWSKSYHKQKYQSVSAVRLAWFTMLYLYLKCAALRTDFAFLCLKSWYSPISTWCMLVSQEQTDWCCIVCTFPTRFPASVPSWYNFCNITVFNYCFNLKFLKFQCMYSLKHLRHQAQF